MSNPIPTSKLGYSLGRRRFLALSGGGIAAAILAACSKDDKAARAPRPPVLPAAPTTTTGATDTTSGGTDTTAVTETTTGGLTGGGGGDGTIKIGYVSPKTGSLASFGTADDYVVTGISEFVKDGLLVGWQELHRRDPRRGQRVESRHRGRQGRQTDRRRRRRSDPRLQHARDHQPGE